MYASAFWTAYCTFISFLYSEMVRCREISIFSGIFETIESAAGVGNLTEADENVHIAEAFSQHHGDK
jgi:hypothetical protein